MMGVQAFGVKQYVFILKVLTYLKNFHPGEAGARQYERIWNEEVRVEKLVSINIVSFYCLWNKYFHK